MVPVNPQHRAIRAACFRCSQGDLVSSACKPMHRDAARSPMAASWVCQCASWNQVGRPAIAQSGRPIRPAQPEVQRQQHGAIAAQREQHHTSRVGVVQPVPSQAIRSPGRTPPLVPTTVRRRARCEPATGGS